MASAARRRNAGWAVWAATFFAVFALFHVPLVAQAGFAGVVPFWDTVLTAELFAPAPRFPQYD